MESVYFYQNASGKEISTLLEEDFFKRIGFTVRECHILGSDRKGFFLYIKANAREIECAEKKFEGIGLLKLTGDEHEKISNAFRAEEENAASGMGMIFG